MIFATPDEERRFWDKVQKAGDDDCWEWQACRTGAKALGWYGRFALRNRRFYAHRVAWCIARGFPIDYLNDKLAVMHTCDNPTCCNPRHLELGTQLTNIQDMIRKNRNRGGGGRRRKHQEIPV